MAVRNSKHFAFILEAVSFQVMCICCTLKKLEALHIQVKLLKKIVTVTLYHMYFDSGIQRQLLHCKQNKDTIRKWQSSNNVSLWFGVILVS